MVLVLFFPTASVDVGVDAYLKQPHDAPTPFHTDTQATATHLELYRRNCARGSQQELSHPASIRAPCVGRCFDARFG